MSAVRFDNPRLMLIAMLEASGAILFMIPRTRALGLLLVSAYLGGAIVTHLGRSQSPEAASPAFVLALFWHDHPPATPSADDSSMRPLRRNDKNTHPAFSLPVSWTLLYTFHIGKPSCFNTLIP
ncbi:MAG: hypothetical protein DMG50_27155 [Acidobacteria bacterium]|nr:MAG: hypothetical protein DMG50_27155 [Acidobacteriota bacterium]